MKIAFLCLALFLLTDLNAQDTTVSKSNRIYWKWPHYRMDGKRVSGKNLRNEFYKVPEAVPYYKKANTNMIVASLMYVPITVAVLLIKKPSSAYYVNPNDNNIYYASLIFSGGGMIYSLIRYKKNMKKAIRIHNEKIALSY